jgi:hypothetical protein
MTDHAGELPLLVAVPGMTVADVVERSTAQVGGPRKGAARGCASVSDPHRCCPFPAESFELPPARFSTLHTRNDVVARVRCTPQLRYLGPSDALEHAFALRKLLEDAGWRRIDGETDDALQRRLAGSRGFRIAAWQKNGVDADMVVVRRAAAGVRLATTLGKPDGAYLVMLAAWIEGLEA